MMNIKKLAALLCTTCLGSLYGDVYDVTDNPWFKAFLVFQGEKTDEPGDYTLRYDKEWGELTDNQKARVLATVTKEQYDKYVIEKFVCISKELIEQTGNAQGAGELTDKLNDVLRGGSVSEMLNKIPAYEDYEILGKMQRILSGLKSFSTSADKISVLRSICNTLEKQKMQPPTPMWGELYKEDSIPRQNSNNQTSAQERYWNYVKQYHRDWLQSLSPQNDEEKVFKNFAATLLFKRLLDKFFPTNHSQPGCAMFVDSQNNCKFYIATKKRGQCPDNDPVTYDKEHNKYNDENTDTSKLLICDENSHTERQLALATLSGNSYCWTAVKNGMKFDGDLFKILTQEQRKLPIERKGTLYVFTKDSPCWWPIQDNHFYPCTRWWQEFAKLTQININIYYKNLYTTSNGCRTYEDSKERVSKFLARFTEKKLDDYLGSKKGQSGKEYYEFKENQKPKTLTGFFEFWKRAGEMLPAQLDISNAVAIEKAPFD